MSLVLPAPGVYAPGPQGRPVLVHAQVTAEMGGGDYVLSDIADLFGLGTILESPEPDVTVLALTAKEVREVKALADAFSFDYDPSLIELCLDIHRFVGGASAGTFTFAANF